MTNRERKKGNNIYNVKKKKIKKFSLFLFLISFTRLLINFCHTIVCPMYKLICDNESNHDCFNIEKTIVLEYKPHV